MMTDAELVALLLAEARLRKAYYASQLNTDDEKQAFTAYKATTKALRAAVQERLDAEDGTR